MQRLSLWSRYGWTSVRSFAFSLGNLVVLTPVTFNHWNTGTCKSSFFHSVQSINLDLMETGFRNVSKLSVCRLLYIIWNLKFSESMPFIVLVIYFISFPYGEFQQLYSLFKTILSNGLWFVSINILPHFWAKYFVCFNDSTLTKVSHSNRAYLF